MVNALFTDQQTLAAKMCIKQPKHWIFSFSYFISFTLSNGDTLTRPTRLTEYCALSAGAASGRGRR